MLLRITAFALAVLTVLPARAVAQTIDEVEARREELRRENAELEERIDALKEDEAAALEYQGALEEKIDLTEQKIDTARAAIELMDQEIRISEERLDVSRREYQSTIDMFAQRIKALYKAGSVGTLEILLDAKSFSEFTLKSELLSCVTKHDQKLLDKIEEYLEQTKKDRENLQKMREKEAETKKELESSEKELKGLYEENEAVLASLGEKQKKAQEAIAANEEEDAELEERLADLIRQKNEEEEKRKQQAEQGIVLNPPSPGMHDGFSPWWPLPGYGPQDITGHYGDMYDNGPHNGMDIGVPYGTPIVAAQAGQVISAEFHWSWGNNVLIWHNDTFATRYAHMSSIAVSAGEYVEQGQVIGYVGSTGYSFGNHLHFEVYVDAVRVAPEPYLGLW